jgi:hypothetical protein
MRKDQFCPSVCFVYLFVTRDKNRQIQAGDVGTMYLSDS